MRLFHFSEEPDIAVFDPFDGLVWAIDDEMAVNYLFPRECPRVTFGAWESTTEADRAWFDSLAKGARRLLVIEAAWLDRLRSADLVRYEFAPDGFELQDRAAGYWVSTMERAPIGVELISNLVDAIEQADGQLIVQESLWPIIDQVAQSSLRFSIIRARNAVSRSGYQGWFMDASERPKPER